MSAAAHNHRPQAPDGSRAPPRGIGTAEHLAEHLAELVCPSMAIVGVGNELCGDDGVGVLVARQLAGAVPWQVFETGSVPESFLIKIVGRRPGSVILVDAIDFAAPTGTVELFDASSLGGQGPSTHGPAPLAFLELLAMMHPCRRAVLGIQPSAVAFGDQMNPEVLQAARLVAEAFGLLAAGAADG